MQALIEKIKNNKRVVIIVTLVIALISVTILTTTLLSNKKVYYDKTLLETITVPEATNKLVGDYFGVLVLGSDQGATKTNGGNHTDSVTYVAINKKTNKAYALPIYRDAFVYNTCTGVSVNINHIYRDSGADCMVESVSGLLGLPIDYYIYITSNGFVDLFNEIGPLAITAEATFESKFGNDDNIYYFTNGQTQDLNGNQLLAYTRYRGNTSGEMRAQRHIQVLNKAYEVCLADATTCLGAVVKGMLSHDIQTNLPYESVFDIKNVAHLEMMTTLAGTNFEDATGWHQRVSETDLAEKVAIIKAEIFV